MMRISPLSYLMCRLQCRTVQPLLWEYAAERLSEGPMEDVERHIALCGRCRQELETCYQSQALLTHYREHTPPAPATGWAELRAQLQREDARANTPLPPVEALRYRPTPVSARTIWSPRLQLVSTLTALCLFSVVGYHVGQVQMTASGPTLARSGMRYQPSIYSQRVGQGGPSLQRPRALPSGNPYGNASTVPGGVTAGPLTSARPIEQASATATNTNTIAAKPVDFEVAKVPERTERAQQAVFRPHHRPRPALQMARDTKAPNKNSLEPKPLDSDTGGNIIKFEPRKKSQETPLKPKAEEDEPTYYPMGQLTPVSTPRHFVMGAVVPAASDLDSVY